MVKLSIIIPAYNEEKNIKNTLETYIKFFRKDFKDFEIIVEIDGCTDQTSNITHELSKKNKEIKILEFKKKLGKGGGLKEAFKFAQGDLIGFVDADMSTEPKYFFDLVKNIKDFDCVIASRKLKGSKVTVKTPPLQQFGSWGFNLLIKIMFGLKFKDTQCGAKLFKKEVIKSVVNELRVRNFAFDVQLLYQIHKKKYKVKEIPTVWEHKLEDRAFDFTHRFWHLIPRMFLALLKIRFYR